MRDRESVHNLNYQVTDKRAYGFGCLFCCLMIVNDLYLLAFPFIELLINSNYH